jgi:hypothetical protein
MSTVRIARQRIRMGRDSAGIDRRGLLIAMFLCVALFVCCFAIGRAASPGSAPREAAPASLPIAFTGTAIPVSLSSAPAIELQTGEGTRHRHAGTQTVASRNARVTQAIVEATPRGQDLSAEAPRSSSPASQQVPAAPAPVTTTAPVAPASGQGGGGSRSQHSGGGTSFDSSG